MTGFSAASATGMWHVDLPWNGEYRRRHAQGADALGSGSIGRSPAMRRVYQVICHIIAACVVVQAAAIAWGTFTISQSVDQGGTVTDDADVVGFIVHGIVGQVVIPLLAVVLLVIALIGRAGIKWSAWLLLAVVVQVVLGYVSFEVPGLGVLHGIIAFAVLGLAETASRTVTERPDRTPSAANASA
jgi:hypothetical protein